MVFYEAYCMLVLSLSPLLVCVHWDRQIYDVPIFMTDVSICMPTNIFTVQ